MLVNIKQTGLLLLWLFLSFNVVLKAVNPGKKIAVVGDLQRTSTLEFLMAREDNDTERGTIISSIAKENPGIIVMLGDMVYDGSDMSQWSDFKELIQPISKKKIPIYPVIGNHEYWGPNTQAMKNVRSVFPILKRSGWYSIIYDSLALIFLDSNSSEYTGEKWDEQRHWFENKMQEFDDNPNVLGIFVFAHHPPYTNSVVTGDEIPVQQAICPAFSKSKKGMILFSGHAHTYEKFYIHDKYYIVSGGGGGPRVMVKTGLEFHHDLCTVPSPRPFHYIILQREEDGVSLVVNAIDKGSEHFYKLDKFYLYFHY